MHRQGPARAAGSGNVLAAAVFRLTFYRPLPAPPYVFRRSKMKFAVLLEQGRELWFCIMKDGLVTPVDGPFYKRNGRWYDTFLEFDSCSWMVPCCDVQLPVRYPVLLPLEQFSTNVLLLPACHLPSLRLLDVGLPRMVGAAVAVVFTFPHQRIHKKVTCPAFSSFISGHCGKRLSGVPSSVPVASITSCQGSC